MNYGKPFQLNCAEAFGAALYITGFREEFDHLMSKVSYGDEFLKINEELLDNYAACKDSTEVVKVQNEWLEMLENERSAKANKEIDLPPTDSEDEYYE